MTRDYLEPDPAYCHLDRDLGDCLHCECVSAVEVREGEPQQVDGGWNRCEEDGLLYLHACDQCGCDEYDDNEGDSCFARCTECGTDYPVFQAKPCRVECY